MQIRLERERQRHREEADMRAEIARLREALEWCEGVSSEVADPQLSLDQARVLAVSIRIRARKALEGTE